MLLWVGLGNPGDKYAGHRHNVGFMAVDECVRRHASFGPWRTKFSGQVSEGTIAGEKILLLKPETFMNESGRSVAAAARFYKIDPARITVFHDELDLAHARLRIKTGGGHGGHNGLRSVDAHMGKDYQRVRLGIGHPGSKERVLGHVLSDFGKAEREGIDTLLDAIARNAGQLVAGDATGLMNKVNQTLQPPRNKKPEPQLQEKTKASSGALDKPENTSPFAALKKLIRPE